MVCSVEKINNSFNQQTVLLIRRTATLLDAGEPVPLAGIFLDYRTSVVSSIRTRDLSRYNLRRTDCILGDIKIDRFT